MKGLSLEIPLKMRFAGPRPVKVMVSDHGLTSICDSVMDVSKDLAE
jgi:hypothetical protein